ncbi:MAG: site-specific DNA-methyltransferase [Fibromonadaceae bacterium]|jgi:DNA modification methylase|nr:site-specific DNA-methyltransferase [Fibromonadaceae bacterium]
MKKSNANSIKLLDIKTELLVPYAKNARTHSPGQIEQVANSIIRFGFTNPILIQPDNTVVAGHCRLEAAKKIGLKSVPCIVLDNLTPEQCRALVIADNKLALNAGWDFELLASELAELQKLDFNLDVVGFTDSELAEILEGLENTQNKKGGGDDGFDADAAAEEIKEPITKRGDIWQLGTHRLMCGDSTEIMDFEKLMNGVKVDMVFTDPPYGVSIGDKNKFLNKFQKSGRCTNNIKNDTLSPEKLYKVLTIAFTNIKSQLKDVASVYVTAPQGGGLGMMMMMMMMKDSGLEVRHVLNWIKNSPTFSMGRLDYDYQHEPILFTWNKSHKRLMKGTHKTSCWFIDKPRECKLHPTMKPIELISNAILNSSDKNDIVLDSFGGSGSTLISCEQLNRKCYMMELDPIYCDVIIKRWEQLTGGKAELCKTPKQKSKP